MSTLFKTIGALLLIATMSFAWDKFAPGFEPWVNKALTLL